ncbi:MAG: hypothetical protein DWQ31_17855 [Planctomycetota bacterium]|nr:MAG: hypothetical protein DWQ31_17855 [Planctomycetota bacterium]REJ97347.1 MAG: hypothetical protein DWQ35_01975 [Planctomycetota bacterium]REK27742.1 MAG: hypothetical protein DWQ42_07195 [Planctomycetota bacterium]REK48117.1 MAG: hypothetical protein DWQ46_02825 [Planctomycetota bacterium]
MGMIEVKQTFSRRELLWFGPLMALFAGLLGWFVMRQFEADRVAYGLWGAAGVLIAVYYAVPRWQAAIFKGWIYAFMPIGWVVSHVLLAIIYYLLLTPIGLLMKVCGYDPMQRKFDRTAESYWIRRDTDRDKSTYFKQY